MRRQVPMTTGPEHSAANRRLGWTLLGIFATLTTLAVLFIMMRSH